MTKCFVYIFVYYFLSVWFKIFFLQFNALFIPFNILIIPPFQQLYYQIGLLYYKIRQPFRRTLVCWCKNVRDDISTSRVESTSRCEDRRRYIVMDRCDNIRSRKGIQLVGTNLSNLMPGYLLPPSSKTPPSLSNLAQLFIYYFLKN